MLSLNQINKYLHVDAEEGIVTWKYHDQRPDLVGREAGSINQGYRRISVCGYQVYRYQIIWFVHYGVWPTTTIDHQDTDMLNDRISNLREATKAQNVANSGMNVLNTSGYKGVSFCKSTGRWRASISIDRQSINLGRYDTAEEAHQAWLDAAINARGEEFVRACA